MNSPKKSLGQNFLLDNNIIRKIVGLVDVSNRDILEIGPGRGALTNEILKRNPKSLILVEKDCKIFDELKMKYKKNERIKIYNKDILKFEIEGKIKKLNYF